MKKLFKLWGLYEFRYSFMQKPSFSAYNEKGCDVIAPNPDVMGYCTFSCTFPIHVLTSFQKPHAKNLRHVKVF